MVMRCEWQRWGVKERQLNYIKRRMMMKASNMSFILRLQQLGEEEEILLQNKYANFQLWLLWNPFVIYCLCENFVGCFYFMLDIHQQFSLLNLLSPAISIILCTVSIHDTNTVRMNVFAVRLDVVQVFFINDCELWRVSRIIGLKGRLGVMKR